MSRHLVDTSIRYTGIAYETLLDNREIEDPEVDPISMENPPTKMVSCEPYLPDEKLVELVSLALALGRHLLLQGDPGCGKTRLAYAVAYELGLPLEECYIKSTSRAQDLLYAYVFFFQAEDGIRDLTVTGVQTCALPICGTSGPVVASAAPSEVGSPGWLRLRVAGSSPASGASPLSAALPSIRVAKDALCSPIGRTCFAASFLGVNPEPPRADVTVVTSD